MRMNSQKGFNNEKFNNMRIFDFYEINKSSMLANVTST